MSDTDYDTDVVRWSERQAALLRERAAGKLVNEADFERTNIAEEIECVGITSAGRCMTPVSFSAQMRPN